MAIFNSYVSHYQRDYWIPTMVYDLRDQTPPK